MSLPVAIRMTTTRILFVALAAIVVACDADPTGTPDTVVLGTIAIDEQPEITVVADEDELAIEVTTYGGGCHAHHGDDVDVNPFRREIVIRPYDRITGYVCTDELVRIQHRITLRAYEGDWIVRVIGFDRRPPAPLDPNTWEPPRLEVEIPVTVGGVTVIGIPDPNG